MPPHTASIPPQLLLWTRRIRSLDLLHELLRSPAIVEQQLDDAATPHMFAEGVIGALRSLVDAACSPGGGAAACTPEQLWKAATGILFGDEPPARWELRRAVLHWVALPLAHAVAPQTLIELLKGCMVQAVAALERCKLGAKSPLPA